MYRKLRPRILSVDDDPGIGALMLRLLEETGRYKVAVETDAFRALQTARQFRPDLVMLDVNMPGQDGLEVARRIRAEPWLRYRPIIIFTGMPAPLAMQNLAAGDGPIEYLQKGVPLEAIVEAVDRCLAAQS